MSRYTFSRKLNLKNYVASKSYETADFTVLEADTPEQAQQECEAWVNEYIKQLKEKEQPFE